VLYSVKLMVGKFWLQSITFLCKPFLPVLVHVGGVGVLTKEFFENEKVVDHVGRNGPVVCDAVGVCIPCSELSVPEGFRQPGRSALAGMFPVLRGVPQEGDAMFAADNLVRP